MTFAIKPKLDRLRVFSYIKRVYEEECRVPSYQEVADVVSIPVGSVGAHIKALRNADGFPKYRAQTGLNSFGSTRIAHMAVMARGANFDENALELTDIFGSTDGA